MTDKIQKIKDWISKTQDDLMDANGNFEYPEHEGAYHILCSLDTFIDSMQKEPVSDDLEKAAKDFSNNLDNIYGGIGEQTRKSFKAGAKWQKDRMMLNAIDATCFGIQGAALFSFRLPAGLYLVGSKVKVIVIRED